MVQENTALRVMQTRPRVVFGDTGRINRMRDKKTPKRGVRLMLAIFVTWSLPYSGLNNGTTVKKLL